MNKFFLVCPIGLENALKSELTSKSKLYFPPNAIEITGSVHGGIEVQCELSVGLSLNYILRTPSKILLRIKEQKCRDLPKFYNIIKKIPWKTYLNEESAKVSITAKKSRLIHTGRIEDSFHKALKDYFEANKLKEALREQHQDDPLQNIFIRFHEDNMTVSLDTSGELLHIRGDRSFRGLASIRENIASLLLIELMSGLEQKTYNLIDPMCGTGTFLYEWSKRDKLQSRKFAFETLSQNIMSEEINIKEINSSDHYKYYGFDINAEIIEKLNSDSGIEFKQQDIFEAQPITGDNIVIVNPPFGKRVKIEGDKIQFFDILVKSVKKAYNPKRMGLLIPRDYVGKLKGRKIYFKQNGIDICFLIIGK